jgi:bacillithiol synthase
LEDCCKFVFLAGSLTKKQAPPGRGRFLFDTHNRLPMQSDCTYLSYRNTGYFSALVEDYINGADELKPFYDFAATVDGIKSAVAARKQFATNRPLLADVLKEQYKQVQLTAKQQANISLLTNENTFTVCTAHQPNIFTGYLYFIYKIVHAIKLAEMLTTEMDNCHFVPVYYMGSEDADLEELGQVFLDGKKYEWKTDQQGAVGRMKVDKALVQLVQDISGQLLVHPYGSEIVHLVQESYKEGVTIQQATFNLVNNLFAEYGLLILLPDNRLLKDAFAPVIKRELLEQFSHTAVAATVEAFPSKYKIQAAGRELNMFYLEDNSRERIERVIGSANPGGEKQWTIVNREKTMGEELLLHELKDFPERFSPNVILRPVYQETILPNVAFIGGGGEIAYWLELKKVFEAAAVPYPVLVVRNSFLLVDEKSKELIKKLNLSVAELFTPEFEMMNELVKRLSNNQLSVEKQKDSVRDLYKIMGSVAGNVDSTLQKHTEALLKKSIDKIEALEKKIIKAEKRRFEAQQRQLRKLKAQLFPHNNLQERVENFMLLYAKGGSGFIKTVYDHSLGLEQEFGVITTGSGD